jgi:hypothetical protein
MGSSFGSGAATVTQNDSRSALFGSGLAGLGGEIEMPCMKKCTLSLFPLPLLFACAETPTAPDDVMLEREHGRIGGLGSQYTTRQLPSEGFELRIKRPESIRNVASAATHVASVHGKLIATLELDEGVEIKAMVGSGYMNMNPAVVSIFVTKQDHGSNVIVKATAKEGLIKQGTSEKAVRRIADSIREYLDERPSSVKPASSNMRLKPSPYCAVELGTLCLASLWAQYSPA